MVGRPYRLLQEDDRTFNRTLWDRSRASMLEGVPFVARRGLSDTDRKRLHDKRIEVKHTLEDLTELANEWPEDQLRQVFTEDTVIPFIMAILQPRTGLYDDGGKRLFGHIPEKKPMKRFEAEEEFPEIMKDWEKRRERILDICKKLIDIMNRGLAWSLAPKASYVLNKIGGDHFAGVKAISVGE